MKLYHLPLFILSLKVVALYSFHHNQVAIQLFAGKYMSVCVLCVIARKSISGLCFEVINVDMNTCNGLIYTIDYTFRK